MHEERDSACGGWPADGALNGRLYWTIGWLPLPGGETMPQSPRAPDPLILKLTFDVFVKEEQGMSADDIRAWLRETVGFSAESANEQLAVSRNLATKFRELCNLAKQGVRAGRTVEEIESATLASGYPPLVGKLAAEYVLSDPVTLPTGRSKDVQIFISHSHLDRSAATRLQSVLHDHGSRTFLDQDRIQAGDVLPERVTEGIRWCNCFLLLWSHHASRSEWVRREWNEAYDQRKKIVPYQLDGAALPEPLADRVYVEASDQYLANASLLRAVFGPEFKPSGRPTLFPGKWRLRLTAGQYGGLIHALLLRENGQIEGSGQFDADSLLVALAKAQGYADEAQARLPVTGTWKYESTSKTLTLDLEVSDLKFGSRREVIRVIASGTERTALTGTDDSGRSWWLEREE